MKSSRLHRRRRRGGQQQSSPDGSPNSLRRLVFENAERDKPDQVAEVVATDHLFKELEASVRRTPVHLKAQPQKQDALPCRVVRCTYTARRSSVRAWGHLDVAWRLREFFVEVSAFHVDDQALVAKFFCKGLHVTAVGSRADDHRHGARRRAWLARVGARQERANLRGKSQR